MAQLMRKSVISSKQGVREAKIENIRQPRCLFPKPTASHDTKKIPTVNFNTMTKHTQLLTTINSD